MTILLIANTCFHTIAFAATFDALPSGMNAEAVQQINVQLDFFYADASNNGVDQKAFDNLYIGDPMHTYEYANECITETVFTMYPIFSPNEIILFAIVLPNENGTKVVQLTECFAAELSDYYITKTQIALLYDAEKCYVLADGKANELCTFSYPVLSRNKYNDTLETCHSEVNKKVVYTELSKKTNLNYNYSGRTRSIASVIVSFVSQNPPSNICWAASVACIGNYLTGFSYTAQDIAEYVYGSINWDQGASLATALQTLYNVYNVAYTHYASNTVPSDSLIYQNLSSGYPVYSRWSFSGGTHITVIRGIITGSYIYVMDPEDGFCAASKSSDTYIYVSGYSGVTLTLIGYGSELA